MRYLMVVLVLVLLAACDTGSITGAINEPHEEETVSLETLAREGFFSRIDVTDPNCGGSSRKGAKHN